MKPKAEAARLECEGDGTSDVEALFALVGRSEATEHSSRCSWMRSKAKAAHLEQEGVGTPDVEALFAS
ncbi:hypothetical protein [Bacillus cereus group sp. BY105LC]|uniref:hypothetical protein n=1 Tax=Bacillus cereus group sp. BY105LC TaxID=3018088 RepID=UPI0022E97F6C|nr:hypothetical protein [Bacillus cereus group sp. BY105LC]MDA1887444.1 hypothetical protein [Bacillus cereus group sp. BY105LC]